VVLYADELSEPGKDIKAVPNFLSSDSISIVFQMEMYNIILYLLSKLRYTEEVLLAYEHNPSKVLLLF
jgi:hypothetical protein